MKFLLDLFKSVKEQSLYYNMTFAIILFFILFIPVFIGVETLNKVPELVQWRLKYLPYIAICFIVFFVFGGGQFIKRIVDYFRDKKVHTRRLTERRSLLLKLEELYNMKEVKEGWKTQKDCINWSNKVAPLLQFNNQYYTNFVAYAHRINIPGLSSLTIEPAINIMLSQLQMAIEELRIEIND